MVNLELTTTHFVVVYIQVAARVTPDNAEKDEWFVVKVIHFDREAKE